MARPKQIYLVVGGKYHDMDFARRELLGLLAEHDDVHTVVAEDYRDVAAIEASDALITYTCDVRPSEEEQCTLRDFVAGGKRWYALHGTNSVLDAHENFEFSCPRTHTTLMETLGSRFLAHPMVEPYRISVAAPDHPLVAGIEPFEATDELYLCEYFGEIEPLLETRFVGDAWPFRDNDWQADDPRLVMYVRPLGEGAVLYLTLGHCRGRYDMRPLVDEYPVIERGAWELPVFYELLRRGIRWAKKEELT